ncbi:MAG: hypothetical protein ACI9G1_005836 [Pirellulaceae bacterium]
MRREPTDEQIIDRLASDVQKKQYYRPAVKIDNIISALMSRRGYAQQKSNEALQQAWAAAAGKRLANECRVGNLKRGVLEVFVSNSTVLQEITFQKRRIVKKLKETTVCEKLKDVKFRIGALS